MGLKKEEVVRTDRPVSPTACFLGWVKSDEQTWVIFGERLRMVVIAVLAASDRSPPVATP
jgi:hypothetical protein